MVNPELQSRIRSLEGQWWHSLDLGEYGRVEGRKSPEMLDAEWARMRVPDLTSKSVLDIGAWDGYFSFRAERQGASAVTALDHFVWSIDSEAKHRYEEECRRRGEKARSFELVDEVWRPDELPGRAPFDAAHTALDSRVTPCVLDFSHAPSEALPRADITFFLGVLYHLPDPVDALRRLRGVTGELAIIETEGILVPGAEDQPLWEFLPRPGTSTQHIEADPTNWWTCTAAGLRNLLLAAGFREVEEVSGPALEAGTSPRRRAKRTMRRTLELAVPAAMPLRRYRSVFHARV